MNSPISSQLLEDQECPKCKEHPEMTIDNIYVKSMKMVDDIKAVSAHLASLQTNHERVLYIHSILKEKQCLPTARPNTKDDNVSLYYRLRGNEYHKLKQNFEAWQCYNLSLLYAVPASDNYAYAISNRSASFFSLEKYEECVNDINYLFTLEYPECLEKKLKSRKEKCLDAINAKPKMKIDPNDTKIAEILKFKGKRDERYVAASSKLEVLCSKEMGRHVIAKEDIKVGEVIVQEDPFISLLLTPQFLFACNFCLSRNMNLYPCSNCVFSLYCSAECRQKAEEEYHADECLLLPELISLDFTKLELLALRATLKSKTQCKTWEEWFETFKEVESRRDTDLYGCVEVDGKWVYDSKYYTSIHTLATNIEKRSLSDIFQKSVSAAVLTDLLMVNCWKLNNENIKEQATKYLADTLLTHLMTSPTNMHGISSNMEDGDGKYIDECNIGCAAFAFLSLINHSCAPNVVRCTKMGGAQTILVAIRPIKKGMQIFDNYGSHHALEDRATRQKNLQSQYKFKCLCEACVNDWPMFFSLPQVGKRLPSSIKKLKDKCLCTKSVDKLMVGDKGMAVKLYQPLCELIEALEPYAPCRELAESQETLKQCMLIFQGLVPIGYNKLVKFKAFPPCCANGSCGPAHNSTNNNNQCLK